MGVASCAFVVQAPPVQAVADATAQPSWFVAASGAIQGAAQNLVKQAILHPFDTIKTRVQAADAAGSGEILSRRALFADPYRGFLPCIVSGTPGSAAFFAAKESAAAALKSKGFIAPIPTLGGVVAGVLAAKAVRTPFDVAETRAMASVDNKGDSSSFAWDGSWNAVRSVYAAEGIPGLYRGYGANVAYKLPADAAKFLAYEALRGTGASGALPPGVAGAVATLLANALTTPLDVVRTRVMVDDTSGGVISTFARIFEDGDYGKLWSGWDWRLVRGVVAGGIQFTVLEETKSAIEGKR